MNYNNPESANGAETTSDVVHRYKGRYSFGTKVY